MKQYITEPRAFEVEGIKTTCNIKFVTYNGDGFYTSVSEVAKVIKSLLKKANFEVVSSSSDSYSWGDSVHIKIKSELSEAQKEENKKARADYTNCFAVAIHKEPRENLVKKLGWTFEDWKFNWMDDLYEYRENSYKLIDPKGGKVTFTTKYVFIDFARD